MNEVAHRRKLCGQDDRASEIQSMLSVIASDAAPANEFYVSADVGHLDVVEEEMAGSGQIFHPHFEPYSCDPNIDEIRFIGEYSPISVQAASMHLEQQEQEQKQEQEQSLPTATGTITDARAAHKHAYAHAYAHTNL